MKIKSLIPLLVNVSIAAGVSFSHWNGIVEIENLTTALVWVMIILTVLSLFVPSDQYFSEGKRKRNLAMRMLFFANVTLMFAAGWFFTASCFLLAWVFVWGKRINFEAKAKQT